jgi:hypothetical protein
MAPDPTEARFPQLAEEAGAYESFYIKACHPAEPLGVWIRYTVHKRPGEQPLGSLWCTLFDAELPGPAAVKETRPAPQAGTPYIAIGDATLSPTHAHGHAGGSAWELEIAGSEPPLQHLPRNWMYRAPLPRTKLESPLPDATFSGWIETAGRHLELQGWRGMTGHNWGREHAERWIWLHGTAFADAPGVWLDVALGRIKIAGRTSPWVANGALALDGERHRLGGLAARGTRVDEAPDRAEITLTGPGGIRVTIAARAPQGQTVGWIYADPAGGAHHVANCSIAALSVRVERKGRPPVELATDHGGAYELGAREPLPGVAVQPYADP